MPVFTYTNRLMDEALLEMATFLAGKKPAYRIDGRRMTELVLADIVRHKGCYLLSCANPRLLLDPDGVFEPNRFTPDRTGYECFENHLHMDAWQGAPGRPNRDGIHNLALGVMVAEILRLKLQHGHPGVHFHIIVSYSVRPLDPTDPSELLHDCTVRFHALRDGEVIYDDLEAFRFEAMGIVDVGPAPEAQTQSPG